MSLVFYATAHGPGVGGDATIYLTTASNLIAGKGLGWVEADGVFRVLPYTPPFYPLALAVIGLLGDMVSGARWFNILLFGATVYLTGWAFLRLTRNGWLAATLGWLVGLSPVLLGVEVWAMSEPLFLLLGFGGLALMLLHLENNRWHYLVAGALLLGLAFLSRYIGLAFVLTGGLFLVVLGRGAERRLRVRLDRVVIKEALLYGAVAVIPMLLWLVVDFLLTGTVGSRSGQPASAYWARFLEIGPALLKIYLFWLLPDSVINRLPGFVQQAAWLVPLALVAAAAGVLFRRLRARQNDEPGSAAMASGNAFRLAAGMGIFIAAYLIVMAGAQVFTFPPITLASRMLSPVHLAVLVLLCGLVNLALVVFPSAKRALTALALLVLLAWAASYGLRSALIARDYHELGIGYNALAWKNSPTIAAVHQLPAGVALISNESTAIMYLAGRPAYALQEIYQSRPLSEPFPTYGAGSDPAQVVFREGNGALVLFSANLDEDFSMYGDRRAARLRALTSGLYLYYQGADGAIYFAARPPFVEDR